MTKSTRSLALSLAGLLWLVSFLGTSAGLPPAAAEPGTRPEKTAPRQREHLDEMTVEALLRSLTFEDFGHREAVARQLGQRDWQAAADLVRIAEDESLPLHLQARYMLRRTFWPLVPKLAAEVESDDPAVKAEAREAFRAMVELYPLDAHHHGGLQKVAIVLERLGRHEPALEAYRRWDPPQTGCGTCTAGIAAERIEGMVHCLRELKQFDEAAELCWALLRNDQGFMPTTQFAVALVEIYDAQDRLDDLADELAQLDGDGGGVRTALEYLEIRRDFRAGNYEELLPHLTGGTLTHINWTLKVGDGHWRRVAVAEAFGRLGDDAVPILAAHLEKLNWYNAGWTVHALQLTGSPKAIKPMLEFTKRLDYGQFAKLVTTTLLRFPEESTQALIPLLEHRECAHGAITQLSNLGTEAAVEGLIEHFNGEAFAARYGGDRKQLVQAAYARRCVGALWRLTDETLGTDRWSDERLLKEGQDRWERWWSERPKDFQVKTPSWWRSSEAVPKLLGAMNSPSEYISGFKELLAMEHPVMARYIDSPKVAEVWIHFDPQAAIPALIPHAHSPGYRLQPLFAQVIDRNEENAAALRAWRDLEEPAEWRAWWETYKDELKVQSRERWW